MPRAHVAGEHPRRVQLLVVGRLVRRAVLRRVLQPRLDDRRVGLRPLAAVLPHRVHRLLVRHRVAQHVPIQVVRVVARAAVLVAADAAEHLRLAVAPRVSDLEGRLVDVAPLRRAGAHATKRLAEGGLRRRLVRREVRRLPRDDRDEVLLAALVVDVVARVARGGALVARLVVDSRQPSQLDDLRVGGGGLLLHPRGEPGGGVGVESLRVGPLHRQHLLVEVLRHLPVRRPPLPVPPRRRLPRRRDMRLVAPLLRPVAAERARVVGVDAVDVAFADHISRALLPQPVHLDGRRVVGDVGRERALQPVRLEVRGAAVRRRQLLHLCGARHRVGVRLLLVPHRLVPQPVADGRGGAELL
mmetsp:Transcript_31631/g.78797  ORF Transcript_31631/g.78797 Transcript_31631/m.78797 type:complete len:357 (-) Transcript_31631:186-1256(-)